MDWELTGDKKSLQNVLIAAESLASRWSESVGAIRSWDAAINNRYSFTDMDAEFLVIIDSMCSKYHLPIEHSSFWIQYQEQRLI
jgi:hypothetical protein